METKWDNVKVVLLELRLEYWLEILLVLCLELLKDGEKDNL
jgi:hypothetical protein